MGRVILPYDKTQLGQTTSFYCGPATTQVLLSARGQIIDEATLAAELGTDQDGTDYIGLLEKVLSRRLGVPYRSVYLTSDPPSSGQVEAFWASLRRSIDGGYGVAMNWVVPPSNRPRGVLGSQSPSYPGSTVWHYVAALGYDSDARAVWVVDSGFWPREYWCALDQVATLIPPKGYAFADVNSPAPPVILPSAAPASKADQYALAIINEGRNARTGQGQLDHPVMTPRGIKIALATALVESGMKMYANQGPSMNYPHDAVGSDHDSEGLFQQRPPWWGTTADRMDAARSAALFYNALAKRDYNNESRSPGWYAQNVQQSAFRDRYDERYPEAEQLYNRLAGAATDSDPLEELLMLSVPSVSIYATPGEPDVPVSAMIQALDAHGPHEQYVEAQARAGDPDALARVARTAAGKGKYGNAPSAVAQAVKVLADIEASNPKLLQQFLNGGV